MISGNPRATDPLEQLRGLHLPEEIGLWPPAPGWWLLVGLFMLVVIATVAAVRARRRSVRSHALRELEALTERWSRDSDFQTMAAEVSMLLRRIALKRYGQETVAALHGESWQRFLSKTGDSASEEAWDPDIGRILALAPYAPPGPGSTWSPLSRDYLLKKARHWIEVNS
jgi:hypothetical protein